MQLTQITKNENLFTKNIKIVIFRIILEDNYLSKWFVVKNKGWEVQVSPLCGPHCYLNGPGCNILTIENISLALRNDSNSCCTMD